MKKNLKCPKEIQNFIFDQGTQVGRGTYGTIHPAYRKDSEIKLACKVISKTPLKKLGAYDSVMMRQTQQQFQRQITFHKKLNENKHIVRLEAMAQDDYAYYIFMEYCESDLAKKLEKEKRFSQSQATDYIKQLCQGYIEIYNAKASHRDLKPENLLLRKGILKIADFGFVRQFASFTQTMTQSKKKKGNKDERGVFKTGTLCGTPQYIPPNVIQIQLDEGKKYDAEKFDMWSIGIIYYLFLYGQRPFSGKNSEQLYNEIQKKQIEFPQQPQVSEKTKNIISNLLNKNEQQRLQFRILLKHLNIQQPKKYKQIIEEEEPEDQKQKLKKTLQTKFRFIEFIDTIIKLLYTINWKYSNFTKFFVKQSEANNKKYFIYKIITKLHQLRRKKNVEILTNEEEKYPKQILSQILEQVQFSTRIDKISESIKQYQQNFYEQIKALCGQQSESLEQLLEILSDKLKQIDFNELELYDIDVQRAYLCLLRLKEYVNNKLKNKKFLLQSIELKDTNKILEFIKGCLKTNKA